MLTRFDEHTGCISIFVYIQLILDFVGLVLNVCHAMCQSVMLHHSLVPRPPFNTDYYIHNLCTWLMDIVEHIYDIELNKGFVTSRLHKYICGY